MQLLKINLNLNLHIGKVDLPDVGIVEKGMLLSIIR